jgi:hypothetical protein
MVFAKANRKCDSPIAIPYLQFTYPIPKSPVWLCNFWVIYRDQDGYPSSEYLRHLFRDPSPPGGYPLLTYFDSTSCRF